MASQSLVREPTRAVREWTRSLWRIASEHRIALLTALAGGLLIVASKGFGMEAIPLGSRLLFVFAVIAACEAIGAACDTLVRLDRLRQRPILRAFCQTAVSAGPRTLVAFGIAVAVFGHSAGQAWAEIGTALFYVVIVSFAFTAIRVLARRAITDRSAAEILAGASILERLPPRFRSASVLAVEAQDHYLQVHTDLGATLIKMRFADALDLLTGSAGAQTHRSWWVAKSAVHDVQRGSGRASLVLSNGMRAPVSRRFAKELRENGWY